MIAIIINILTIISISISYYLLKKYTFKYISGKANYVIDVPVYGTNVMFSFGESIEECKNQASSKWDLTDSFLPKENGKPGIAATHYSINNGKIGSLIRMKNIPKNSHDFDTLQHEILHATLTIMRHAGVKFDLDNQEPFCYLQGYLTGEIYKKILNEN